MSTRELVVISIHGIGYKAKPGFSNYLISGIRKSFPHLTSYELLWGTELDSVQDLFIQDVHKSGTYFRGTKALLTRVISDALAYQPYSCEGENLSFAGLSNNSIYGSIHHQLAKLIYSISLIHQDFDLVLIGHSLGTIIVNNFVWDCLHESSVGCFAFKPSEEVKTVIKDNLTNIINLGSPYSYWGLRHYHNDFLPVNYDRKFTISNFYFPSDIVAAPISPLPNHNLVKDEELYMRHPLDLFYSSHLRYFKSSHLVGRIREHLNLYGRSCYVQT